MIDPTTGQDDGAPAPTINGFQIPFMSKFVNPAYATPEQRKELYAYANAMMKPQPIKSAWQGMAEIARALVGGHLSRKADEMEQLSRGDAQQAGDELGKIGGQDSGPTMPAPAPGANLAPVIPVDARALAPVKADPNGDSARAGVNPDEVYSYAAQAAAQRGIDPKVATSLIRTEFGNGSKWSGDEGSSHGPLQLHYGNVAGGKNSRPGMGDEFTAATGLHASDPSTWKQQIDFGLDKAAKGGWAPWATSRDKLGMRNFTGIGNASVPAANPNIVPKTLPGGGVNLSRLPDSMVVGAGGTQAGPPGPAMAFQGGPPAGMLGSPPPQAPRGVQMAQNSAGGGPVSPQALSRFMTNPNIDPAVRNNMFNRLYAPQTFQDANGNVRQSFQAQPVNPPIAELGVADDLNAQNPTIKAVRTGPVSNTRSTIVPPGVAPASSGAGRPGVPAIAQPGASVGASINGPGTVLYDMTAQQRANQREFDAQKVAGDASADQFSKEGLASSQFNNRTLPLTKAIPLLESLGAEGTGPGSDTINHIKSFLQTQGFPIGDSNKIMKFDEAKKYLTDYVNQTGNSGTNDKLAAAFAGNPSVEISNAAAADVAKTALAMQRYNNAMFKSFESKGLTPDKYADHARQFSSDIDPRAFGLDLMSPDARKKMAAEMPPGSKEREKFNKSLAIAVATGMVKKP